jgi:hypothetical protein
MKKAREKISSILYTLSFFLYPLRFSMTRNHYGISQKNLENKTIPLKRGESLARLFIFYRLI